VDALLTGTGGARGWPEDGCSCASCMRARAAGVRRAPGRVLVDGQLALAPDLAPQPVPAEPAPAGAAAGHQVRQLPGGWDVTGPDGRRLLVAAGPGAIPRPADGTSPFDIALLDLLADPAQLGLLRAGGFVHERTSAAALYTDHRVSSEAEMARRCGLWGVTAGHDGLLVSCRGDDGGRPAPAVRPHRTLIIGGARSGKSSEAQLRLAGEPRVTYLAAGPWAGGSWQGRGASEDGEPDAEWAARVAAHRAARPSWWRTEESLDVAGALRRETGALLIDGIGTWLAAVMDESGAWADADGSAGLIAARIAGLIEAWRQTSALVVAVTDQVGSGLVPAYPAGRQFRDQLGWLNQLLAAESDANVLVVAGRVMALPA
jgi:adenosylcobinamide kinase / adenosylcobinamide-phosphate guanylyltransferase